MLKKKCPSCAKKVERKFSYCPHCGASFKANKEQENFGMLGREDSGDTIQNEIKLPFGVDKIMNSLIKQLEKQMGTMDFGGIQGMPKGINIRIARGPVQNGIINQPQKIDEPLPVISREETQRRLHLPKVEGASKVKRLSDVVVYEIDAPGIKKKEDVVLTELASGLEIKAYSKDKCYVKFIPLKFEVVEYHVEKEKVIVELR